MEKLMLAIGVALLICAVVAAGYYGWHGQWGPVLLALCAAFLGKMALGFAELLLTPLSLPLIYFAKRGNSFLFLIFAALSSLATRAAYAAYCAAILLYLVRTPGPPTWLAVALALVVASAPFHWAAKRAADTHPSNMDLLASMFGVLIAGTLLAFDVRTVIALLPIAVLFVASAALVVVWWVGIGLRQIRLQSLFDLSL
jgi:hypothetical protein